MLDPGIDDRDERLLDEPPSLMPVGERLQPQPTGYSRPQLTGVGSGVSTSVVNIEDNLVD